MRKSLTREERLRRREDIRRLFAGREHYRIPGLHLRMLANNLQECRVLVTTPRMFRGAVQRNRARRHVREAYRLVKHRIHGHYDLAFVVYPGEYRFSDRSRQVETLLRQAGAVQPE